MAVYSTCNLIGVKYIQYRSKLSGPKYAHKTHLHVKHARIKYAQKANSVVFMSWPIVVIFLLVLMAVCGIHVKPLDIQLNMFYDCYSSQ